MVVDQRAMSLFEKLVEEAVEHGEQGDEGGRWRESVFVELLLCTRLGAFSLQLRTPLWYKQHCPPVIDEDMGALREPGDLLRCEW